MKEEEKNQIIIVYAASDRYTPYMGVSMSSLIQHTSEKNFYKIYVLSEDVTEHHRERILNMAKENVDIEFVDVTERMKGRNILTIKHISKESAYRLLIDEIFNEYSKVIYIDSDTVINRDVAELYALDIEGYILGCSRASLSCSLASYIKEQLKLPLKDYFNAGILLINIPMFHKYQIGKKCFELLENSNKYVLMDQDALNLTCYGHVSFFDGRWNVEWENIIRLSKKGEQIYIDEVRKDILTYSETPYIVHYTSHKKPWMHPEFKLAEYFWENARRTEFYEEILFANKNTKPEKQNPFQRFLFPWNLVKPGSRVILHGAGVVGRAFYEQIKLCQYCCIKAICDKNYQNITGFDAPVIAIEDISGFVYDVIVIAIEKEEIAMEVQRELESSGISSDKIVWTIYKRR